MNTCTNTLLNITISTTITYAPKSTPKSTPKAKAPVFKDITPNATSLRHQLRSKRMAKSVNKPAIKFNDITATKPVESKPVVEPTTKPASKSVTNKLTLGAHEVSVTRKGVVTNHTVELVRTRDNITVFVDGVVALRTLVEVVKAKGIIQTCFMKRRHTKDKGVLAHLATAIDCLYTMRKVA